MKKLKGNVIKVLTSADTPFAEIKTDLINNPDLSANGLRTYMHLRTTTEGWHTSVDNIMSHTNLSRAKVIKALKELEDLHLLKRNRVQDCGRYEYTYIIYDAPFESSKEV